MYVEPSTTIRVLTSVNLTPSYEHTIWFGDRESQAYWFSQHTKYTFSEYTYQRVQRGYIRVGMNAERLYDCNYMMFQNSAFGSRWFYAFIDNVEYINNETTEIHFHIDVVQTWLLDANVGMCFVERNHDMDDWVGSNLVPEPFTEVPVKTCYEEDLFQPALNKSKWCYIVLSGTNFDGESDPSGDVNGIYSGLKIATFNTNGNPDGGFPPEETLTEYLKQFSGRADSIVAIYKAPMDASYVTDIPMSQSTHQFVRTTITASAFDGYVPRNQKMYTAPYCYPVLETISGKESKLRFEWFLNSNIMVFSKNAVACPAPELYVYPFNYAGEDMNYDAGISLGEFAQASWVGDTFKMWLAENTFSSAVRMAGTIGQIAYSGMVSNPYSGEEKADETGKHIAARAGIEEATNILSNAAHAASQTNPVFGNVQKAGTLTALGIQSIYLKVKAVPYHIAVMIDTYFSKYGYAQNAVRVPHMNSRPHWTYLKTMDATISGNVPADDLRALESIFNNGITFWRHGEEVGNYNLDNRGIPQG